MSARGLLCSQISQWGVTVSPEPLLVEKRLRVKIVETSKPGNQGDYEDGFSVTSDFTTRK